MLKKIISRLNYIIMCIVHRYTNIYIYIFVYSIYMFKYKYNNINIINIVNIIYKYKKKKKEVFTRGIIIMIMKFHFLLNIRQMSAGISRCLFFFLKFHQKIMEEREKRTIRLTYSKDIERYLVAIATRSILLRIIDTRNHVRERAHQGLERRIGEREILSPR